MWASAYSLHCSSFLWFNQVYLYVYIYIVSYQVTSKRNYNGDYRKDAGFRRVRGSKPRA